MKLKIIMCMLLIIPLLSGCVDVQDETQTAYGVEIHIKYSLLLGDDDDLWINNTNNFSVRIKQVWVFKGETTEWIDVFEPYESRYSKYNQQYAWHIYTMDGVEVGWIQF